MTSRKKSPAVMAATTTTAIGSAVIDPATGMETGEKPPLESLGCAQLAARINEHLAKKCSEKRNTLPKCSDKEPDDCGCSGGAGGTDDGLKVDMIVLIDTSSSMGSRASLVSDVASAAVELAQGNCKVDLHVTWLGLDGIWPGTVFTTSHRDYLTALTSATLSTDNPVGGYDTEEGANAIEDLSQYAAWREGACRAIFYISDEELDGSDPVGDVPNEDAARAAAVTAANANNVTVFAHYIPAHGDVPTVTANYQQLCTGTGGTLFVSLTPTEAEYTAMLAEAICGGCGDACRTVEFPELKPCISVSWGDSDCDCLESDDLEVLCITVCNCYANVTFSNLHIGAIYLTDAMGGAVAALPGGGKSVEVIPPGPLCFGDIPPCTDGRPGCVSRQFVLRARGAKAGPYRLMVAGVCYDITTHHNVSECFTLSICAD